MHGLMQSFDASSVLMLAGAALAVYFCCGKRSGSRNQTAARKMSQRESIVSLARWAGT